MCGTRALVVGAAHQQQEHALEDDLAGGHGEGSRIPRPHLAVISAVSQLPLPSASQLLPLGCLSRQSLGRLRALKLMKRSTACFRWSSSPISYLRGVGQPLWRGDGVAGASPPPPRALVDHVLGVVGDVEREDA